MQWLKSFSLYFLLFGFSLIFSNSFSQNPRELRYTQQATIPFEWEDLRDATIEVTDTIDQEVIKRVQSTEGVPLFYAQDIFTSVCFDNHCRPLNLTVYWNITGRYLGFKLPSEEFLSKYDHEPFSVNEYQKLNSLLADPYLPLGHVSFHELIEQSNDVDGGIDGVSGATSKDILAYVVEGAAYTTYTMWNIIYGPMKTWIGKRTEQEMTLRLLALVLQSPMSEDRIWGLRKIEKYNVLDTLLIEPLLDIIVEDDFFAAYSAINAIKPIHLRSESLQIQLFSKYENVDYSLKKLIIEKVMEAPSISPQVVEKSWDMIEDLNGEQLGYMLNLYRRYAVEDQQTCKAVANLLNSANTYIAKKAYEYLTLIVDLDTDIVQQINKFESNQR